MTSDAIVSGLRRLPYGAWINPSDPGEPGYSDIRQRGSITARECDVLAALAVGRRVLEIGTGLGVSTAALASTAVHVTTVDPDPWVYSTVLPRIREFPNVAFFEDRSEIPPDWHFDLIFVDGAHTAEAVTADGAYAAERVDRPGLVVFHDAKIPAVEEGIESSGIDTELAYGLDTECGLVLVALVAEP